MKVGRVRSFVMSTTRRSPLRFLTRVIVFLLLGAIVNVAVAWGLARWAVPTNGRELTPTESERCFGSRGMIYRILTINPGLERQGVGFRSLFVVGQGELRTRDGSHPPSDLMLYAFESGWPCNSQAAEWRWIGPINSPLTRTLQGGLVTPLTDLPSSRLPWVTLNLPFVLPWRPIWPGFAINTLFYAVVLWGLLAAPFALRRRRRIKRGLCAKCAYPVGTSDVCTECGQPVQPKENVA